MATIGGLYVLIDPAACRGRNPVEVGRAALEGGASMLQWRDKLRDKGEQLPDARALYELCQQHDAILIINDHADLALIVAGEFAPVQGGIGVHVGQQDLPLEDLWAIVPEHFVVGASTNNPEEALVAEAAGADYVAVGDIFGTPSKTGTRPASPARLKQVKDAARVPVIGIGGINLGNLHEVVEAGADGIAVISAVCSADDPTAAARALISEMRRSK